MTESMSQSSVIHITSLGGVSPLAQFNGQLGHYTANSLFPQMSQWLGTWASMHMHTHAPLAHIISEASEYIVLRAASCLTLVCLHVSVGMVTCMFSMLCWLSLRVQSSHFGFGPELRTDMFIMKESWWESGEGISTGASTCLYSVKWANRDTTSM